jgi:hypothetical protein
MTQQHTRDTAGPSGSGSSAQRGGQGGSGGFADEVRGGLGDMAGNMAEGASELWDDAYEQGRRYYRQGSEAVGQVDPATLSGWLVAGAIGFGLAWLLFGPQSRSVSDMTRRMSESSERPSRRHEHRGGSGRHR